MTQTLTAQAMQEIYEAAVHAEATGDDQDACFELLCKLEDIGGTGATIRKLIDMVRADNREAKPVGFYTTVSGRGGVVWHNGAPADDTAIYTAPPAPVVNPELTRAPEVDEQVLLEQFKQWWSSKERGFTIINADLQKELQWEAWQDCRATMLAAAPGGANG
jgi:hypothetical protein